MSRTLRAVAALSIIALLAGGCSKKEQPQGDLPNGATLMAEADKAMSGVTSAHFTLDVAGEIAGVTVGKAEGDLTKEGSAKGTAQIAQAGVKVETSFVIIGDSAYLKGPTGGYNKIPLAFAAAVYDPSAILDPERGVAKLLRTAKAPQTVAKEGDAYKVTFEPDPAEVQNVIPTKATGITGTVWIDATTKKVVKGEFGVPGSDGKPGGTIVVTFSNFDVPVSISAP
ncbi:MAG: LppX_LprAFG lipoprotein [Hamadaea sp.]|nr:LppX_LprAFG lipoprotein [Hamadaea sp.]